MTRTFILFFLICISRELIAQNDTLPFASSQEEITFDKINEKRKSNVSFAKQTLNYSPLSYACPPAFDLGSPKKWYILSADIIPEFIIASPRFPFAVHLTARYKVRILHNNLSEGDSSLPVRTPSFMPGATVYIPLKLMNEQTTYISYVGLSFFHHSNGQDGKEFKSDGSFNLYNGNFSTNYIEPSFHFRRRKYIGAVNFKKFQDSNKNYNDLYGSAGIEFHLGTADALKSSYGEQRLNIQLGYINVINFWEEHRGHRLGNYYYGENYRVIFNGTLIGGKRDYDLSGINKRINADLNYYRRLRGSPNTSLFASVGYYGSDTYNIYYANSYFFVRAGIALGFFIAPGF